MDSLKLDFAVQTFTGPEPITVQDLKPYLRVDFSDDDVQLIGFISSCRMLAEAITNLSFAPQTIQAIWTMPQINAGSLTGPKLLYDQDFYQYNESLGANPYSPAPFILSMPQPPLVSVTTFEYRITAFASWTTWPQSVSGVANYVVDTLPSPGVVYLQYPPPAYQYRLTYVAGYTTLPADLRLGLLQYIAWKYDNRQGEVPPSEIMDLFMGNRIWVL
jgi:hypothetical protein